MIRSITRIDLINGGAVVLAVVLAAVAAVVIQPVRGPAPIPRTGAVVSAAELYRDLPGGGRGVADASGRIAPVRDYRRIISADTVADAILLQLCEPERILSVTGLSADKAPWRHRYAGLATIARLDDIEALVAARPDLVIAASLGDPRRLARLEDAGLQVFDIGSMRGVVTYLAALRRLGALLGRPDRAEILARRYRRSLAAVAADVPAEGRKQALYLSAYGNKLFGGTRGTNYHDILTYAGLRDRAADHYEDWPSYSAEQLLALDPELIVTRVGQAGPLCELPGLARLRACQRAGAIIELESFALDDPGPGVLESAEALRRAVYGDPR
ncbi:MAG: ABC transporter substrate-binding protein [Myxococcota bacterium]